LPLPLVPDAMVIQDALLAAVQLQPAPAVTAALAVPPLDERACEVGDTVNEQVVVGAASVIVTVCPATVMFPPRDAVPVFADTL
jgi:hypothetical protein